MQHIPKNLTSINGTNQVKNIYLRLFLLHISITAGVSVRIYIFYIGIS